MGECLGWEAFWEGRIVIIDLGENTDFLPIKRPLMQNACASRSSV